ncbi:MAG: hypothetical protein KDK36_14100 [Leptospiraceae bacterium]|nr:hypothetical protein [Leptospiraceae bacterium]
MKYLLILLLLFSFCKKKEVVSTEENIPETKSGTGKYDPTKTRGMAPLVEITPE